MSSEVISLVTGLVMICSPHLLGVYPEMDEGAILFGGTDPGRFNPTYMIFCESFLPSSKKPRDPDFDRRDVYLITQNALADGTIWITSGPIISAVLSRIHPSSRKCFAPLLKKNSALTTNSLAQATRPLDQAMMRMGAYVEE